MKMLARAGLALSAMLCTCPATALPVAPACTKPDGTYIVCAGVQEPLGLATANTATAAQQVYGGTYIFAQMATGYGTISLVVLGPDNATYETIVSKTASDTTGGTTVPLQGGATVKVVLTGTTGANVTLTRVP